MMNLLRKVNDVKWKMEKINASHSEIVKRYHEIVVTL